MTIRGKYSLALIIAIALGTSFVFVKTAQASYVQNNLIADSVMLDATSMGTDSSQIQAFLNEKKSYLASYSPYSDRDSANVPAAQIIYEAAYDYGINPKAILATLQKEESLVTDQNPSQSQLDHAMGYGCPDSSQCQAKYYGFYNQVANGAWQLRFNIERVLGNNSWWNSSLSYPCNGATKYYNTALRTGNNVTFSDDYGTAYDTFTLQNAATSALYCYTPHAYPGSSQEYYSGSYNFVTSFESWFGSTQPGVVIDSSLTAGPATDYYTNTPITASVTFHNNTNSPIDIGTFTAAVRDQNNNNYDFPLQHIVVPANGTYTYQQSEVFTQPGTYTVTIGDYRDCCGWTSSYPTSSIDLYSRSVVMQIQAQPTVTAGLSMTPSNPRAGQNFTASFSVQNNDTAAVNLGTMFAAVRDANNTNWDLPADSNVTIQPGATYTYSQTTQFTKPGNYTMTLSNWRAGAGWSSTFPVSVNSNITRTLNFTVLPSPTVTASLTSSNSAPHAGQTTTLSFQVTNYGSSAIQPGRIGVSLRDPNGSNYDPFWDAPIIAAGQTYTYSINVPFDKAGAWTAEIANYQASPGWNNTFPVSENGQIIRKLTMNVAPSITVTSGLSFSDPQPRAAKAMNATFTITNFSANPVSIGRMGVAVRDGQGNNLDLPYDDNVTVPANGTYTFNKSVAFNAAGSLKASIANYQPSVGWNSVFPASENGGIARNVNLTVQPSPTVTTSLTSSNTTPRSGQTTNFSFQVTNYGSNSIQPGRLGVSVRDPSGANYDPFWDTPTIAAGQTYTYFSTLQFDKPGTWVVEIGNYQASPGWNSIYPVSENGQIVRKLTITVGN